MPRGTAAGRTREADTFGGEGTLPHHLQIAAVRAFPIIISALLLPCPRLRYGRALRGVADRLLGVACVLLRRQVLFDPEQGKPATA